MKNIIETVKSVVVTEFQDGSVYVYKSNEPLNSLPVHSIVKSIINHNEIGDLSNTYDNCIIQLLNSHKTYTDVDFYNVHEGTQKCSSTDGIGDICTSCKNCTILNSIN